MGPRRNDGNETIELHDAMKGRLHHRRNGKEFRHGYGIDSNPVGSIWVGSFFVKHGAASVIGRHIEDINASTVSQSIWFYHMSRVTAEQDVYGCSDMADVGTLNPVRIQDIYSLVAFRPPAVSGSLVNCYHSIQHSSCNNIHSFTTSRITP